MKTGRRGFLKGVLAVAVAPLLALLPKRKPEFVDLTLVIKGAISDLKKQGFKPMLDEHWGAGSKKVISRIVFFRGQALQYEPNLGDGDDEIYVGPAVPADFTPGYPRACRFIKTDTREEIMEKLAAKRKKATKECIAIHEKMLFADTDYQPPLRKKGVTFKEVCDVVHTTLNG